MLAYTWSKEEAGRQKDEEEARRRGKPLMKLVLALLLSTTHPALAFSAAAARSSPTMLIPRKPSEVQLEIKDPVDPAALAQSRSILDELRPPSARSCDPAALLSIASRLGDVPSEDTSYVVTKERCRAAFDGLSDDERTTLVAIHARVKAFAEAQRRSVCDVSVDIPGGKAGQSVSPCRGTFFAEGVRAEGAGRMTMGGRDTPRRKRLTRPWRAKTSLCHNQRGGSPAKRIKAR